MAGAKLRGPEQRLVDAVATGVVVDLSTGDPVADDPAAGAGWPAERTVRAEMIARLVTGTEAGTPRAVRLRGARVTGELDLQSAILLCPLVLEDCHFDEPVNLWQAQAMTVRLPGCRVPSTPGSTGISTATAPD